MDVLLGLWKMMDIDDDVYTGGTDDQSWFHGIILLFWHNVCFSHIIAYAVWFYYGFWKGKGQRRL